MPTKSAEPQQLEEFAQSAQGIVMMPRGRIVPRAIQPRTEHQVERQKNLGQNIRHLRDLGEGIEGSGILQPLQVTWEPGAITSDGRVKANARVLINIGETRYHATSYAGFTETDLLPVHVSDSSDRQAYENALIENLLRDDMSPHETAAALRTWMNTHDPPLSYAQAGARLGKSKSWVQVALAPLNIGEDVQSLLDGDPKRLTVASRINNIKDPEFRQQLIESVQKGAKTPAIMARISKFNSRPEPEPERYGTEHTPGVPIVPRLNIPAALDSAIRQAEAALDALRATEGRTPAAYKRNVRERAGKLAELAAQFGEELDRLRREKGREKAQRYREKSKA